MWWAIAAAQGDQDADENIGYLASEISKNDLLKGLRRAASAWKATTPTAIKGVVLKTQTLGVENRIRAQ